MKKLAAMLMAMLLAASLMISGAAMAEQYVPVTDGFKFGMSQDELIAALGGGRYETDYEHTRGGVDYAEVETEHQSIQGLPADIMYRFVDDRLAAVCIDYEDGFGVYEQVKAALEDAYGAASAVDLAKLGNGIYVADDDGRFEGQTECWFYGDIMIVLEKERDSDVNLYLIDLAAAYIR